MRLLQTIPVAVALVCAPALSWAATYQVGPGTGFPDLASVLGKLQPGDVVEVQGGVTYPPDTHIRVNGTKAKPIVFRGVLKNGKRPVVSGGDYGILLHADHLVLDGFEVTGSKGACVLMKGDGVVVRNSIIHDCPMHGILGTDEETGNLTIETTELYKNGAGDRKHQVYVATDETSHKGSVFRMQHCYIHDATGGVNVKSRAERTELYYNWIEGAMYQELDLIGADGHDENLAREDADVVGNVFRKTTGTAIARLGGDGTGQSKGRYRFVNNTMLLHPEGNFALRAQDGIEAVELHNNVIYREKGQNFGILRDEDAHWVSGPVLVGSNNWVNVGTKIPPGWTETLTGSDPGFTNFAALDLSPKSDAPLVNSANESPAGPAKFPFSAPLFPPTFMPVRKGLTSGSAPARPRTGRLDIGAFENPTSQVAPTKGSSPGMKKLVFGGAGAGAALVAGAVLFFARRKQHAKANP